MQLILAIDADRRQADELSALVTNRLPGVELIQATSAGEALQTIGDRVPDLILTSALLSPFDDGVLAEYLRELGSSAAHVQALRIPVLSSPKPASGSLFSFGRKKRPEATTDGCDPGFFADEILVYLARASEERQAASESQLDAEHRDDLTFTAPQPDVTPTYVPAYVPAYAPEPYVSPYEQLGRATFELPAAEPEDGAPIYVTPASVAGSTEQDPAYGFRAIEPAPAYGFRATPRDLAYDFRSPRQDPAYRDRVDDDRVEGPPVRAAADAEDNRETEPSSPAFLRPSAGETVVGVAPLTTTENQGDPDLFVLDAATVSSEQSVFELSQTELEPEPVEAEEESRVPVYSLDERYEIPTDETETETPSIAILDSLTQVQEDPQPATYDYQFSTDASSPEFGVVDLTTPAAPAEDDLGDLNLNVAAAPAESDAPAAPAVVELLVADAPEPEPPSPPPYRVEPSHVRVKSRSTVAFEAALAAIRRAWGKPRKQEPRQPEPVAQPEPASEPIANVLTDTSTATCEPTPEQLAPQFFEAAPAPRFEASPPPQLFEEVSAPQFFEAAPAAAIQLDGDDSIAHVPELAEPHESEAPVEPSFHADAIAAATMAATEFVAPDDVHPVLHDELESPIAAEETASPDLVERLIRAVLTKEPITSILADRPATPPGLTADFFTSDAAKPVLADARPAMTPVEPVVEPESLTLDTAEPVLASPRAATAPPESIVEPAPVYDSSTREWSQPNTTSTLPEAEVATAIEPPAAAAPLSELAIDDGIPDAAARAALEVDLTRDLNALEEESFVAMPEPVPTAAVPDEDVYELDASPGCHDLESEIAAAAPPRPVRESLPRIESHEPEPVQARADGRKDDRPRKKGDKRKAGAKPRTSSNRPVQDEWGLFDPNRCGFAALVDKLNEVSEEEDPKANQTTVRVISYR